jgi:hypothetical protein
MKAPRIVVVALVLVFALSFIAGFTQAAPGPKQEAKKQDTKQPQREIIPKEVKAVIQEGLATRQGRQDIPFTVFKSQIFPVQGGMHAVLFFKAKNADFGYAAPVPPAPGAKNQPAQPAAPAPGTLEARLALAIELFQPDPTGALKSGREYTLPMNLQTDAAGYDPNKEEWYSVGFALPFGKYTVAMVICPVDPKKGTADIKKLGVAYHDFVLPGPETYAGALETTPVLLVRSMESMPTYEPRPTVHRALFTYSVLQIVPNIDNVVTAEDKGQIEAIFFILGAKPKDEPAQMQSLPTQQQAQPQQPKYDIEINYEVQKEDGSTAVKWQSQSYLNPLVDQTLPLKKTTKTGDKTEVKDLEPGKYSLVLKILDKVSQLKLEKKVPFEVK